MSAYQYPPLAGRLQTWYVYSGFSSFISTQVWGAQNREQSGRVKQPEGIVDQTYTIESNSYGLSVTEGKIECSL